LGLEALGLKLCDGEYHQGDRLVLKAAIVYLFDARSQASRIWQVRRYIFDGLKSNLSAIEVI